MGRTLYIHIKAEEKGEKKEEVSPFDRLHEDAQNLFAQIVERGKKLEKENKRLAQQMQDNKKQVENLHAEYDKQIKTLCEKCDMYKGLYEKTKIENYELRKKCVNHKENALYPTDEQPSRKHGNNNLKESMEMSHVDPLRGNTIHIKNLKCNLFFDGSMQFKNGQMPGSRFQCGSSSAE